MEAAETALARASALLDPTGQNLFPGARLMPYLNIAYAALRSEGLSPREVTVAETVQVLPGVAPMTCDLGTWVVPGAALGNLAAPLSLREKPAGADDSDYTDLRRVDRLPVRTPAALLLEYEWRGGNIYFVGATQALDLQIRYERIWPALKSPADALAAADIANILGFWTAGLMAVAMREQQLGQGYINEARHLLYRWVQQQVLDAQVEVRRPLPFHAPARGIAGVAG